MDGKSGVVVSRCGCCGLPKFVENRDAAEARAVSGEAIFCEACLKRPDYQVELMVGAREHFEEIGAELAVDWQFGGVVLAVL